MRGGSGATVVDQRKIKTKPGTYYTDFDMDKFIGLMKSRPASENYFDSIKRCSALSGQLV